MKKKTILYVLFVSLSIVLVAGSVQVQRAGAEGFQHNEVNPKNKENHMIQLWVLPDKKGESAGYKMYQPEDGKLTHIYGGKQHQDKTFYSRTQIHVGNGKSDQVFSRKGPVMAYLSKGHGDINGSEITARTLISSKSTLTFTAKSDSQIIFITEQKPLAHNLL